MAETTPENGRRQGQEPKGQTGQGQVGSGRALDRRSRGAQQQAVTRASYIPPLLSLSPAALMSTSPFAIMRRFTDELDQIFSSFGSLSGEQDGAFSRTVFAPQIEVQEQDDRLVVRADLPGLSPEDVRVTLVDAAVLIEGERRSEQERNEGGIYRSERSYGAFRRVIPLPTEAKQDEAEARFENGVLEVTLPLDRSRSAGRRLEISNGGAAPAGGTPSAKASGDSGKQENQSGKQEIQSAQK